MKNISTILFDLDGTLLDTKEFIIQATEYVLKKHNYPVPDRDSISKHIGKPFDEYYFILTGFKDNENLQDEHRQFQLSNLHLSILFPNTKETLNTLHENGFRLGIVTSRFKDTASASIKKAGIENLFGVIVSGDDCSSLKPDPEPLYKALENLGELPENAIMVGDSHFDIEAGKNAGTKTVRVTYGIHKERLNEPQPDFFIDDISELIRILS